MVSRGRRVEPPTSFLWRSPAVAIALAVFYAVAGAILVYSDYTLNNEGLLTYYWASWARQSFVAVFFFQKVKPVIAALYAPITVLGPHATMLFHTLVAAAAVPMIAAVARALGQARPNLPAAVIALSPVYFFGGPAGVSNVDGMAGIVFSLYLLVARRSPFAAGLVAGALPWIRFETATFAAMVGLYGLFTSGQRRVIAGLATFPLLYAIGGTIYHGDPLWILHFPGSAPFDPANPIFANQRIGFRYFLAPAAILTPAAAVAAFVRWRGLERIEKALLAYMVLTALLMAVMQITRIGNFGDAPRYMLHLLPPLALLLGRAATAMTSADVSPGRWFFALLLIVWIATRLDGLLVPILIAAPGAVLLCAWARKRSLAIAGLLLLVVAGPVLPMRSTLNRDEIARYLAPMAQWLIEHPEQSRGPIYTNSQLLHTYTRDSRPDSPIFFLAGVDTAREVFGLANPDNGQRAEIERLCAVDLYGKTLMPPFDPLDFDPGSLFALRDDPRLSRILDPQIWDPALQTLVERDGFRIASLRGVPTTPEQRARAAGRLNDAIAAHGGSAALAGFAQFRIVSEGTYKGANRFRREVNYRDDDNWSMSVEFEHGTLQMGISNGQCWTRQHQVTKQCRDGEAEDIALMALHHNAWVLNQVDPDSVRPAADVAGAPSIRAGSMRLVLDPDSHRIAEIRHGGRVEQLGDYRQVEGAWIATRRVLTLDGVHDLDETWIEIAPGDASPIVWQPEPLPADGVITVTEDSPRIVAWTEVEQPPQDLRSLVNALDDFVKRQDRKISWADGVLWQTPARAGEPWRIAIGVEPGPTTDPLHDGAFHLEIWPAQRVLTLFHAGDFDSALAARQQIESALGERGLTDAAAGGLQILAPRTLFADPPDWGLIQVRQPLE